MQSVFRGDVGPKSWFVWELALTEGAGRFSAVRWRAGLFAGGHPSGHYQLEISDQKTEPSAISDAGDCSHEAALRHWLGLVLFGD